MIGALRQVIAALRRRSAAFSFLIVQIAFGTVVVSHALVLGRLFSQQQTLRGLDPDSTFSVTVESDDPASPRRDLLTLRSLPGIRAAAWTARPPALGRMTGDVVTANGIRALAWEGYGTGALAAASGFELVEGRDLTDGDAAAQGDRPVVISAALGRQLFGSGSALGRRLESPSLGLRFQVVGVLREAGIAPPIALSSANVLLHAAETAPARRAQYLVSVAPAARGDFPQVASGALDAGREGRFVRVEPIRSTLDRRFDVRNGTLFMFGLIIALTLGVVLLGAIGMSSFLVSDRRREIGIRRALGATRRDITGWFLFENFAVTTIGLSIGAGLSVLLNRGLVARALPGAPLDISWLFLAMILFWVTGLVAASRPALSAAAVSPAVASRTV